MSGFARLPKRVARSGIRIGALLHDRRSPPPKGITVLAYHQIGGPVPSAVNVPTRVFDDQLDWLATNATVLSLDDAIRIIRGDQLDSSRNRGRPRVVITFDDGTADFVDNAVPILESYGMPATLYLATGHVEEGRSFWDDATVLSWGALADAVSTGVVDIGSHTHSHLLLDRVSPSVVDDELDRSIGLIHDRLGVEAKHFAYPKAVGSGLHADVACRMRFASAAVAGGGTNAIGKADPYQLARQPILATDGVPWFTVKARGGLGLEGQLRDRLDRRRYRDATQ